MSQSEVAALHDAYRAFSRGDFTVASQVLAPDVEWVEHGRGMPYSGTCGPWPPLPTTTVDVPTRVKASRETRHRAGRGIARDEADEALTHEAPTCGHDVRRMAADLRDHAATGRC